MPTTVKGVQRIVKYAKKNSMSVRCAGFRESITQNNENRPFRSRYDLTCLGHSWSPIFGKEGQILISLLSMHEANKVPNTTAWSFVPQGDPTELESISVVSGQVTEKGNALVRVGASCTNERLRRWCVENNKYTLPLNTIMVEMTLGGTNAPICHGSGRSHKTLSDLVRKIEYVDANGKLQVVDNPEHLKAAAGCFGLMGVVTHLTLELIPMSYAKMEPKKVPTIRAIPPPPGMNEEDIPPALRLRLTPEEREADQSDFERHASNDFYTEWFWFPFSDKCWVNCWNQDPDPPLANIQSYPSDSAIFFQFITTFTMNVLQFAPTLHELIDAAGLNEAAATLISKAAMLALPDKEVTTYLPDALHFQRGIQNVRVYNLELEIPLQPKKDDAFAVDYTSIQRAWWDAILTCYRHADTCPQRMPLEMRIMGGSDIVMAPQRGNMLGTASIEILTLYAAKEDWIPYAQEVLDKWMSLTDANGKRLRSRPHWAKQWKEFKVDGKDWAEVLRDEAYRAEIIEFKETMAAIGRGHGWSLGDLKTRFSNDFFDWFFFGDVMPNSTAVEPRKKGSREGSVDVGAPKG
jgi:hypothetical protein